MSNPKRLKLDDSVPTQTMVSVLSDDLVEDTPLIDVYVDSIEDPKNISKAIIQLNSCLPILELTHLKRIKGRNILLCPINKICLGDVQSFLEANKFDTSILKNDIRIISVAKIPPKTRRQYEKVNKHWPCNFHSDKYVEKLATNTLFSSDELIKHIQFMRMAIAVANRKEIDGNEKNIGVVVVDPKINSVVSVGYSEELINPSMHAGMVAIRNVAKTQLNSSDSEQNLAGLPKDILLLLRNSFSDVSFGARPFKCKTDLEEPCDGPYLCTGYYVYITHEPCIMCAMAFIHSRTRFSPRIERVDCGAPPGERFLVFQARIYGARASDLQFQSPRVTTPAGIVGFRQDGYILHLPVDHSGLRARHLALKRKGRLRVSFGVKWILSRDFCKLRC
ncbi:hypothetical protein GWI33_008197 [Rhynchophorus ferrugineus]|uniref:CMP/dCMP-type deaminase domain-containing protein n=1 Tax=Rhynchophorus ferrugineus TaxID=354439 RepID=A0A834IIM9_RHYFE|nr:hypothetical protein GWI33_008197 [Rhynchophorus ferrugineus]